MKGLYIFNFKLDWPIVNQLSKVDRFDASWSVIEKREGQSLKQLKSIATVRSVAASTRIEGSRMSDEEVEVLISAAQKVTIRISDINGHLLMQEERMGDRGGSIFSVPAGRLSKGTYIIHVQSDNMNGSKIFLKQ